MTETGAEAETSATQRISIQLCQRIHSAHLPVIFRGLFLCKFHQVVERRVFRSRDVHVDLNYYMRSDPQGVRYRYLCFTVTTISVFKNNMCVRGGRKYQNDEVKDKKPHAGICRCLSEFGELWPATDSGSGTTLNMRAYFIFPVPAYANCNPDVAPDSTYFFTVY